MITDKLPPLPLRIERPEHLSYSTISSFISNRSAWFMRKILKHKVDFTNKSFARGHAVEHGLNLFFEGFEVEECVKGAEEMYKEETKDMTFLPHIRQSVEKICEAYEGKIPVSAQEAFWVMLNDFKVMGYIDYLYPMKVVDLKTASETPSGLSLSNKIQGCIYQCAYSMPIEFHFVVPLKTKTNHVIHPFTKQHFRDTMPIISKAIDSIKRFYDAFDGTQTQSQKRLLEGIFFPDPGEFWDEKERHDAMKAFGIDPTILPKIQKGERYGDPKKYKRFQSLPEKEKAKPVRSVNPFLAAGKKNKD